MDPRSKAEFDLAMAEFRKAIGQEPDTAQRIRAAYLGGGVIPSPTGRNRYYHTHWAMAPAAARAIIGMHTWTEPSRWDRLKGTFFVRLRDFRRWLGSNIAGCECDTTW